LCPRKFAFGRNIFLLQIPHIRGAVFAYAAVFVIAASAGQRAAFGADPNIPVLQFFPAVVTIYRHGGFSRVGMNRSAIIFAPRRKIITAKENLIALPKIRGAFTYGIIRE
jgi:hypothetical protein